VRKEKNCSIFSLNSFTAKSFPAGTKNSHSEGFLLAKHTAHKHTHHDGAVCLSSGMVSMVEHTPPPGASAEGVRQGHHQRFSITVKIKQEINLFLLASLSMPTISCSPSAMVAKMASIAIGGPP
jgi:hypothetical protein